MSGDLRKRDVRHLWHPYTEITGFEAMDFPIIERAEGVYLFDTEGRRFLDGIASWWCVNLGHSHPRLVAALREQAGMLQHAILGGMSHPRAIELAERLAAITPAGLEHAYFACDGSSAVESALKMAIQYRANIGETGRTRFIGLADGYHGDSLGAMGVGFVEAFHGDFRDAVVPAFQAASPHCAVCACGQRAGECDVECFASMEEVVEKHHREVTAVVVEPLCQGAAGIRIYPEEYLRRLRRLCDARDLLLIADEIAVGFGRTGSLFACERAGIVPDILTLGKGMTGGLLPMSVAMSTERIYDSFRRDGDRVRTFYDGHTFCGNPVTAAVALAALDVYEEDDVVAACAPRIAQLGAGIRAVGERLPNSTVLTLGLIGVVEVHEDDGGAARAAAIGRRAMELGLFMRPLGPAVYLWPPLVSTEAELGEMLALLDQAVAETV